MNNGKSIIYYNDYDKLAWIERQLEGLRDEPDVRHWDVELMLEFVSDLQNTYFEDGKLKEKWK